MALHHIIYQSTAIRPMADTELQELLTQARSFNAAHEITGVLLYHNTQFVQVLEGEEEVISALYEHIRADLRHTSVIKLADSPLTNRNFGDWSMAFRPVDDRAFRTLTGFAHPEDLTAAATDVSNAPLLNQIVYLTFHEQASA
ncbi:BLUF domain-containing protein [Hymenobacter sp. GOD-10R]|uniref:BLUF domain-containing protein n=1 Tax=Hymenobacter sp. GOD-10R TaxID=3093922 RepID=UPI002D77A613|nr:BLUF domain-containing protein [Hymenobacter sp. GOD-10R]WRQ27648.1 BLUF domain-containing protein [Hymenobacter sp. GOD-10R]